LLINMFKVNWYVQSQSVCSKLRASLRSMTTKRTLKTSFMSMAISVLSTNTSSNTLKIKGRSVRSLHGLDEDNQKDMVLQIS
jgi:gas vesicle protein